MASSPSTAAEVSSQSTAVEDNDTVVNTAPGIYFPINPQSLPIVGRRFRPTDEILARHYLAGKVSGRTDGRIFPLIKEVDVYKCEPWLLSRDAHKFRDGIMYFFTYLKMKYHNGVSVNRVAGDGFWKKTGKPSHVNGEDGVPIATKTALAYYMNGQKPGESTKTQWLMKEFTPEGQIAEEFKTIALCVIYDLHDRKRKQRGQSDENVLFNDIVEGSFQNLASDSYCDRRNLIMLSTENPDFPRKRHRPSNPDFHVQDQGSFTPEFNSSSNPATHESFPSGPTQSANAYQNPLNMVMEPQGTVATKPNEHIPYNYSSHFTDFENYYQPEHRLSELSTDNPDFNQSQDTSNPKFSSSSNTSATREILPEVTIKSANSNQNLLNMAIESEGATDTNTSILNCWSPSDFLNHDLLQGFGEDQFINLSHEDHSYLLYDIQLPLDVSEDPSRAAGPLNNND